jgi:hypothetical protein
VQDGAGIRKIALPLRDVISGENCDICLVVQQWRIPVVVRSKAWVCGRSLAGTAVSNPAGGTMSVSCECCVARQGSLRRADHCSRVVLQSVACLSVISKPQQWGGLGPRGLLSHVAGGKEESIVTKPNDAYRWNFVFIPYSTFWVTSYHNLALSLSRQPHPLLVAILITQTAPLNKWFKNKWHEVMKLTVYQLLTLFIMA